MQRIHDGLCYKHGEQEPSNISVEASGKQDEEQDKDDMFITSPLGGDTFDVDNDTLIAMLHDVEGQAYNERDCRSSPD